MVETINKMSKMQRKRTLELGYDPSVTELANALDMSEEKVMEYIFSFIGKWIMLIFSLTLVITLILYIKGDIPIIKM